MKKGITICTWSGGQEGLENLLGTLHGVKYPVFIWVNDGLNPKASFVLDPAWRLSWMPVTYDNSLNNIYLNEGDNYEIGAIYGTLHHTDWDEFVLLQDTFEIKDQSFLDTWFDTYEGQSVCYNPHFQMYIAKYRRAVLEQIEQPVITNKVEAVRQEDLFTRQYRQIEPGTIVFNPHFVDQNFYSNREWKHGRENLVMEDSFIKKFKGTWDANQL